MTFVAPSLPRVHWFALALAICGLSCVPDAGDTTDGRSRGPTIDPVKAVRASGLDTQIHLAAADSVSPVNSVTNLWTIREVMRIGGNEHDAPEYSFRGPLTSISIGPNGGIYVLDAQAAEIRVFDDHGIFVRKFGGPGNGPGELASPSSLAWDSRDRLWVANGFNGRYTLFDSVGDVIRTSPRAIRSLSRAQHQMVFLGDGTFIDEGAKPAGIEFVQVDTSSELATRFPIVEQPRSPRFIVPPGFDREVLSYMPRLVWTITPRGLIWFTDARHYRLYGRTMLGDTLRVIETGMGSGSITAAKAAKFKRQMQSANADVSQFDLAPPRVEALYYLPGEFLLVQRSMAPGDSTTAFDVWTLSGQLHRRMVVPYRLSNRGLPAIRGDTMIALGIGELDIPYIVKFIIRRQ